MAQDEELSGQAPPDDNLDEAFDTDDLEGFLRDEGLVPAAEDANAQFGRTVVSSGSPGVPGLPACNTGIGKRARLWCVTFQQTGQVAPKGFTATIKHGIGQATFQRTIQHFPGNAAPAANSLVPPPFHVLVYGRYVDVWVGRTGGGLPISVSVAICPAEAMLGDEFYGQQYVALLGAGSGVLSGSLIASGAGTIINAHVIYMSLAGAAGVPFYPMFFDATSLPANGTTPLLVLDAVRQLGDGVSFEDQSPGQLQYVTGLYFALSSTPDTLTVALSGGVVVPNVKVGQ